MVMNKSGDLFIVYGSETELLRSLFKQEDSYFIRIYNRNMPKKLANASDVKDFDHFKSAIRNIFEEYKPKRIIFIGAAFLTQNKLFFQEQKEDLDNLLQVNVLNYVSYCHLILKYMLKIKSGHFIYLSSFRSSNTTRGTSIYSSSKAFGEKFFEVLGKENGAFGVYATSIRMGFFDGRMTNVMKEEKIKEFKLSIGNRRLGNAQDLIKCINYVLENPYTNGGIIELTGGISY